MSESITLESITKLYNEIMKDAYTQELRCRAEDIPLIEHHLNAVKRPVDNLNARFRGIPIVECDYVPPGIAVLTKTYLDGRWHPEDPENVVIINLASPLSEPSPCPPPSESSSVSE